MSAPEHTPLPWRVAPSLAGPVVVVGPDNGKILVTEWVKRPQPEAEANTAFIVLACNSHDALVAARDELAAQVKALEAQRDLARAMLKEFLVNEGAHILKELSAIRASHAELLGLVKYLRTYALVFIGEYTREQIDTAIATAEEIQK